MSDKTMFMLIFVVSTALLLYVEATDDDENSNESLPVCQENSDPYMTTESCIQPAQEEFRSGY